MSVQIEAPPALTSKEKQYILRHPADAQLEALLRECMLAMPIGQISSIGIRRLRSP